MPTAVATRAGQLRASLPNHVVARSFVAETVLLDVESGRYFKLDATAGAMLDALLGERTLAAAAVTLGDRGWGPADRLLRDLAALGRELETLGLLRLEAAA
jgi:hypothetical protein